MIRFQEWYHITFFSAPSSCFPPFEDAGEAGCFYMSKVKMTWLDGRDHCRSFGADLAVPTDFDAFLSYADSAGLPQGTFDYVCAYECSPMPLSPSPSFSLPLSPLFFSRPLSHSQTRGWASSRRSGSTAAAWPGRCGPGETPTARPRTAGGPTGGRSQTPGAASSG